MSDRSSAWSHLRSTVPGIEWPPVIHGQAAVLAALLGRLEETQWLGAAEIASHQHRQLVAVAEHAARHSQHFRRRLAEAGLDADGLGSRAGLQQLPVLRRRDLQSAEATIHCTEIPEFHRPWSENRTSGSTGEPVVVRRTAVNQLFWSAITLRELLWSGADFGGRLSAIRANFSAYGCGEDWGPPTSLLFRTGASQRIPVTTDVRQQVEWLASFKPNVLLVYPSMLDAIAGHCRESGIELDGLSHICTVGETLSPRLREDVETALSARVFDNYSSQEAGVIALQCPASGLYHVMSETLIVEVIDDGGRPCTEGEIGRVIVTDLHNFATPLIRYDIGDYAEVSAPCPCGRGLPTLKRILGRERNLIIMPDGTRHWPKVGRNRFRDVAPVVQYQLIQHGREDIEVRFVTEVPLTQAQEHDLRDIIQNALGFPFNLQFSYFPDKLPRAANGKFEEFVCKIGT